MFNHMSAVISADNRTFRPVRGRWAVSTLQSGPTSQQCAAILLETHFQ
jgi:hypothetical protein